MEEISNEEGENNREGEVAPTLIAVHPLEKSVAVAAGSELRIFDLQQNCSVSLVDDSGGPLHTDSLRAICFGAKGRLFASAGDDKLVKIWATDSWHCILTVYSEKRVSAVAISHDGFFVCFADKFGVVWVVDLNGHNESTVLVNTKAVPILAHYCSIITSLGFSPDGRFIVSADRDFKIRVTVFPRKPLDGAHEIQSFCLGHTEFVSCFAFVCTLEYPQGFLLSGSGDSTVRLWDFVSGSLLDTCEVGEVGFVKTNGREEVSDPAITDLCASPDGSFVAVAIQSFHGILLLTCDLSARTLSFAKVVSIGEFFIPTSLAMGSSTEHLWTIMGASNIHGSNSPSLARVKVISGGECKPVVMEDSSIPGGEKLLVKLQGKMSIAKEDEALAASAEAVKVAMRNLLIKKQYSSEKRELRKRSRNDRKLKQ